MISILLIFFAAMLDRKHWTQFINDFTHQVNQSHVYWILTKEILYLKQLEATGILNKLNLISFWKLFYRPYYTN